MLVDESEKKNVLERMEDELLIFVFLFSQWNKSNFEKLIPMI